MTKCTYCENKIPKGRYVRLRYKLGLTNVYCSTFCQNRAMNIRILVRKGKHEDKELSDTDKKYIKKYLLELSPPITKQEMYG